MQSQQINRVSGIALIALSLIALVTVAIGYTQPPQEDEGALAHIFQFAVMLLAPTVLLFLATADWRNPKRSLRPLAFSSIALVVAFGALIYLEHHR